VNCVISMVAAVEDDVAVEIAMIGLEGMAGLPAFLGTAVNPHRSFCQVPGQALRLETVTLRRFLAGDGALHDLLHRYTQAVMAFLAQNIACNRLHSADQRTARWLAQTHDRVGSDSAPSDVEARRRRPWRSQGPSPISDRHGASVPPTFAAPCEDAVASGRSVGSRSSAVIGVVRLKVISSPRANRVRGRT
jgi:hypothetical protein